MKINVGNQSYEFPNGANVTINNGKVIVDGKELRPQDNRPIFVEIWGDVNNLRTDNTATIHGHVLGSADALNSIECQDVKGDVKAGNSVYARDIKGSVKAGNSIHKSFQL